MFADSRFDYLSRVRYYSAMVVTPLYFVAQMPGRAVDVVTGLFASRNDLLAENARLQEQILMQQYQLQQLEHLTAENHRLNELLNASSIVDERVMRVQLVGESPDPFVKRVVINKGSAEGIYIGQPVRDAFGLMGQVVEVEPLTSWVLLITDPQSATPVQINRNGIRAIAAGTRDSLHLLSLNNIPNTADVEVGDVLVTSGLGERFPAGYPVGIVSSIVHDPGKPFADVLVAPTAQIDRSRNLLLVFANETPPAPPLDASGQLPAGANGVEAAPVTEGAPVPPIAAPDARISPADNDAQVSESTSLEISAEQDQPAETAPGSETGTGEIAGQQEENATLDTDPIPPPESESESPPAAGGN